MSRSGAPECLPPVSAAQALLRGCFLTDTLNVWRQSPNVLLAKDWTAKIGDVGLARTLSKSPLSEARLGGTYHWQAPEIILGLPVSYSAGMICRFMLILNFELAHSWNRLGEAVADLRCQPMTFPTRGSRYRLTRVIITSKATCNRPGCWHHVHFGLLVKEPNLDLPFLG